MADGQRSLTIINMKTGIKSAVTNAQAPALALVHQIPVLTSEEMSSNPTLLQRAMKATREAIFAVAATALSNPLTNARLFQGITFTANQTQSIKHGLGHPWTGYFCVRAQTNPSQFIDAANPNGQVGPDAQYLTLKSINAGTYDILCW